MPRPVVDDSGVPDTTELWLARLENAIAKLSDRLAVHEIAPWHASYKPMNDEMLKRLDRLEGVVISMGKWAIGMLAGILAALGAILAVAWRILESKPPAS